MENGVVPIEGIFNRCVSRKRDPLSAEGSRLVGGRFNPKGCAALYLAGTPTLAVAESLQLSSIFGVTRFNPRLLVSVDVALTRVLDLTEEQALLRLGLSTEIVLAEWRSLPQPTLTQAIGLQARNAGVEGILFASRIEPGARNLCVFRENLLADSRVVVDGYDDVWPPEDQLS